MRPHTLTDDEIDFILGIVCGSGVSDQNGYRGSLSSRLLLSQTVCGIRLYGSVRELDVITLARALSMRDRHI